MLIDRSGGIRLHHFGAIDDLSLGSRIGRLLAEPAPQVLVTEACEAGACALPAAAQPAAAQR